MNGKQPETAHTSTEDSTVFVTHTKKQKTKNNKQKNKKNKKTKKQKSVYLVSLV
jgi:hypothetical protein